MRMNREEPLYSNVKNNVPAKRLLLMMFAIHKKTMPREDVIRRRVCSLAKQRILTTQSILLEKQRSALVFGNSREGSLAEVLKVGEAFGKPCDGLLDAIVVFFGLGLDNHRNFNPSYLCITIRLNDYRQFSGSSVGHCDRSLWCFSFRHF